MQSFKDAYDSAWRSIISPYHCRHNLKFYMHSSQKNLEIKQFNVTNNEGKNLSAVIMKPKEINPKNVVFYFHGNGGSKIEVLAFGPLVLKEQIAIISFDFLGCGNSDPGYLTYGVKQCTDAEFVLKAAFKHIQVQKLTVWGRSMGALTAIMFTEKNSQIVSNLILDSPFKSLKDVVIRTIRRKTQLPSPFDNMLFYFLAKKVQDNLGLNIFQMNYLCILKRIPRRISIFYIYSDKDNIVTKEQVLQFFNNTQGIKDILKTQHQHQDDRSIQVLQQGIKWIKKDKCKKNNKLKLFHQSTNIQLEKQKVLLLC